MGTATLRVFGSDICGVRTRAAAVLAVRATYEGLSVVLTERNSKTGGLEDFLPVPLVDPESLELYHANGLANQKFVIALARSWDKERDAAFDDLCSGYDLVIVSDGSAPKKKDARANGDSTGILVGGYDGMLLKETVSLGKRAKGLPMVGAVPDNLPVAFERNIERAAEKLNGIGETSWRLPLFGYRPFSIPEGDDINEPLWQVAGEVIEGVRPKEAKSKPGRRPDAAALEAAVPTEGSPAEPQPQPDPAPPRDLADGIVNEGDAPDELLAGAVARRDEEAERAAAEAAERRQAAAREQAEREAAEEAERAAAEQKRAAEQAEAAEQARLQDLERNRAAEMEAEQEAQELADRIEADFAEAERRAAEEAQERDLEARRREAAEQAAAEEQARQEALEAEQRAAEEQAAREAKEREEAERLAAEERARQEAQEAERRAAEEQARQEALEAQRIAAEEQAAREAKEREEAERLAAEERARQEAVEAERRAAEEQAAREAQEREEAERARQEAEALAAQQAAEEQAAREAREREEAERAAAEEQARHEAEALAAQQAAEEQAAQEAREREEAERAAAEEQARHEAEALTSLQQSAEEQAVAAAAEEQARKQAEQEAMGLEARKRAAAERAAAEEQARQAAFEAELRAAEQQAEREAQEMESRRQEMAARQGAAQQGIQPGAPAQAPQAGIPAGIPGSPPPPGMQAEAAQPGMPSDAASTGIPAEAAGAVALGGAPGQAAPVPAAVPESSGTAPAEAAGTAQAARPLSMPTAKKSGMFARASTLSAGAGPAARMPGKIAVPSLSEGAAAEASPAAEAVPGIAAEPAAAVAAPAEQAAPVTPAEAAEPVAAASPEAEAAPEPAAAVGDAEPASEPAEPAAAPAEQAAPVTPADAAAPVAVASPAAEAVPEPAAEAAAEPAEAPAEEVPEAEHFGEDGYPVEHVEEVVFDHDQEDGMADSSQEQAEVEEQVVEEYVQAEEEMSVLDSPVEHEDDSEPMSLGQLIAAKAKARGGAGGLPRAAPRKKLVAPAFKAAGDKDAPGYKITRSQATERLHLYRLKNIEEILKPEELDSIIERAKGGSFRLPEYEEGGDLRQHFTEISNNFMRKMPKAIRDRGGAYATAILALRHAQRANEKGDGTLEEVFRGFANTAFTGMPAGKHSIRHWLLNTLWLLEHKLAKGQHDDMMDEVNNLFELTHNPRPEDREGNRDVVMRAAMALAVAKIDELTPKEGVTQEDIDKDFETVRKIFSQLPEGLAERIVNDGALERGGGKDAKEEGGEGAGDKAKEVKEAFGEMAS